MLFGCSNQLAEQKSAGEFTGVPMIEILNAREVEGVLTGGTPSDEQLRQAKAVGYRAVIDLRSAKEAGAAPTLALARSLGMTAISIPVDGPRGVTEENARALARELAVADNLPVIIFCVSGNRAGALLALKTFYVDGKGAAESLEFGVRAGLTGLEPFVRKMLQAAPPPK